MRKLFNSDPILKDIKNVQLVGQSFNDLDFNSMLFLSKHIMEKNDMDLLNKILSFMDKESSLQSVKTLLFIHSLAFCNMKGLSETLKETLNALINKIL